MRIPIYTVAIKWLLILLFICIFSALYGQSINSNELNYNAVYAKEFKQLKKNSYNNKLFSLSEIVPKKNWKNYKGGPINTTDSLFHFNNNLLSFSFPTNSDKHKNKYLIYYFSQKSAICPTLFTLLNYYQPIIDSHLKNNQLPKELELLPVVCSAFNPNSSNGIGGEGFWHLNYPQAIKYGLRVDAFVDERRDLEKSTIAATLYLKDLYQIYKDWELTLTAYSCGVTTVNKLLKRKSAKTYKEIYPFLPAATKDIVQAFVAMNYVYNYDNYGAVQLNPIIEADTILIKKKLKYAAINHVFALDSSMLLFLNPTINKSTFPDNYTAYFPNGSKEKFLEFKDSIYFYQDSVMLKPKPKTPIIVIPKDGKPFEYKVKSGDVLGLIADRFNVRVSEIQSWNNIDGTRINVGQKLMIYGKKSTSKNNTQPEKKPVIKKETPITINDNQEPDSNYITYTVKSGDNLWVIAKKFKGISSKNIMKLNGIDDNLNVGQVLKIKKK